MAKIVDTVPWVLLLKESRDFLSRFDKAQYFALLCAPVIAVFVMVLVAALIEFDSFPQETLQ